jgi:20S proteasome alpha/beta subunit
MGENKEYKVGEKVYVTCDNGKSGFVGYVEQKRASNYLIREEDSDKIHIVDDECMFTASWLSDW